LTLVLPALALAPLAQAAAPALNPKLVLRPVTLGDVVNYGLPASTEYASGLNTVAVGTPVYFDIEVNLAIAPTNVLSVNWTITSQPGSSVASLTNSPLGTNVPVYEPSDRLVSQVVSRKLLRPDARGQFTVNAQITTASYGVTNVSQTITAGVFMGVNTCTLCHSGSIAASNTITPWQNSPHAAGFSKGVNGDYGTHFGVSCLQCHTVGYNTNSLATNGGFDDVATQLGWTFPTNYSSTNWAFIQSHYPTLANVANVQCENCHGAGSEHAYSLGNTNYISVTVTSTGDCNQCHDAPTHHNYGTEWYASGHAVTTTIPTGASRPYCVGCHTSTGFISRINSGLSTSMPGVDTSFSAIGCQTCHEPHGATTTTNNPNLLRVIGNVTMPDGSVVTNAGTGGLCLQCHQNRNGSATNQLANYPSGLSTWPGGSSFGPHDGPQGDMIEGINAFSYGLNIPSSAHRNTVSNLCVGCHMQALSATDPGLYAAGGHTFNMSYNVVTNGTTNTVDKIDVCRQCHGQIASFNFPVQDYNGDGVIEGVQSEVQHLLDKLSTLLPNSNNVVDGTVKTTLSIKTNWTAAQLKAGYNWQFVANDGSLGIHNAPYATGLLKASIGDLTGDYNGDGIPDAWQVQYFGSITSANAAPNAAPAGDGIPNWLKYALGLNPMVKGMNVPGGVVYANGGSIGGGTNTVHIYTAAEIAFDTVTNTTYQIQEVTSLSGGWQTIATNIPGTGNAVSYLTPTRNNVQQFFRVVHNP